MSDESEKQQQIESHGQTQAMSELERQLESDRQVGWFAALLIFAMGGVLLYAVTSVF